MRNVEITKLIELNSKNLLSDEELAFAIRELKETKETNELTEAKNNLRTVVNKNNERLYSDATIDSMDEEEAANLSNLVNKNRERSTQMKEEWERKAAEQKFSRGQDEELLLAKTVLASLTNKFGERAYSDEIINNMEYYETMSLYDSVLENMSVDRKNELINKANEQIKEGKGFSYTPIVETPAVADEVLGESIQEPNPLDTLEPENDENNENDLVVPLQLPEDEPVALPGFDEPTTPENEVGLDTPEILPEPTVTEDQVENDEEITPIAPLDADENEEDEEQTIAPIPVEVVQPKPSLWKKVVIITGAAITFLNGIAIAIHTGLMAKDTDGIKKDTSELIGLVKEQDKDLEDEEEEKKDDNEENNLDDSTRLSNTGGGNTTTPSNTPTNPGSTTPNTPSTPSTNDPGAEKPSTPSTNDPGKEEPTKPGSTDTGKEDKDVFPVHLNPAQNETVMDTSTGIEVTADGTTYKHNPDGSYTKVGDQELKYDDNGNAIVNKDNLKDNTKENVEVPKTGEEKPLDEALNDMSEDEQKNLIDALGDINWDDYFDNQQSGPRL